MITWGPLNRLTDPPPNRQTDTTENTIFRRMRAVNIRQVIIIHNTLVSPVSVQESAKINKSDVATYLPELQSWLADVSAQVRVWAQTARCLATWPPGCAVCWPCSTRLPLCASRTAEGQGRLCAGVTPRPPLCGASVQRSARTAPAQPRSDAATPKHVAMKIERTPQHTWKV